MIASLVFLTMSFVPPGTTTAPLPESAIFAAAGYGTKIDGSIGYAQLISQATATYSYTRILYIPVRGSLSVPALLTGAALHLRDFGLVHAYALAQGGVATSTTATVFASAVGAFVTIDPPGWKRWAFLIGADMQKTAGGSSFPNWDLGVVFKP